jgi:Subtilase family
MTLMMKSLIDRLYSKNVLIVAASGNGGEYRNNYPASYHKVISVGAVDQDENIWYGSNYGPALELTGPGASILSTGFTVDEDGNYSYTLTQYSGTSMATPHVAGSAAILFSHFPTCSVTEIRYALAITAKDKGISGCDEQYGYGIVQVKDAFDYLKSNPCTNRTSWGQNIIRNGTCDLLVDDKVLDNGIQRPSKFNRRPLSHALKDHLKPDQLSKTQHLLNKKKRVRVRNIYHAGIDHS